jgi:hypothetical protein
MRIRPSFQFQNNPQVVLRETEKIDTLSNELGADILTLFAVEGQRYYNKFIKRLAFPDYPNG